MPFLRQQKKSTNTRVKSSGTCYQHNPSLLQFKRQLVTAILFLGKCNVTHYMVTYTTHRGVIHNDVSMALLLLYVFLLYSSTCFLQYHYGKGVCYRVCTGGNTNFYVVHCQARWIVQGHRNQNRCSCHQLCLVSRQLNNLCVMIF